MYCKCLGQVVNDFFVKCDGDAECPNGGWMHPQCTNDLKNRTQDELNTIDEWYCEECVERIQHEQREDEEEEQEKMEVAPIIVQVVKEESSEGGGKIALNNMGYGFISQESSNCSN